jgi:DNA recombination protein RmuC
MNTILFQLGDWPVTILQAGIAAFAIVAALLVTLIIVVLRGNTRRTHAAAAEAMEALRANFLQQLAERDVRIRDFETRTRDLSTQNARQLAEAEGLRVRLEEQSRQAEENLKRHQAVKQQMTDEFKLIANDVLKVHGETFSKQNREQVDVLLKPLREKIGEFHSGLMKDRAAMGEQIRALAESNLQITTEAHNLTRALKGSSQTQGAWGEMILATILERSGLRAGEQYFTQQSHTGEDNARLRTDVEILMPNGDRLIIDSKVSLTAFEACVNCTDDDERETLLRAHVTSIRTHIKTLGDKAYHVHAASGLDYVLMFVPIESAFSAAIGADKNLFEYAMGQGVMLTTPSTLMTILRTVRNVWDIEKRHQNAEEIAARAGALYDKVSGFLGTMDKLGTHITRAQQSYDEAKGQLMSGSGNVVRQVEMLRKLGAKSNKQIGEGWVKYTDDADSEPAPENLLSDKNDNETS